MGTTAVSGDAGDGKPAGQQDEQPSDDHGVYPPPRYVLLLPGGPVPALISLRPIIPVDPALRIGERWPWRSGGAWWGSADPVPAVTAAGLHRSP
jgi:hypothetical protein